MGKINNVLNHYFRDKQRFADLFNGVCFHGRTVIKVDSLTDGSEVYYEPLAEKGVLLSTGKSKKAQAGQRLERVRDIKMKLSTGGTLQLLAVENQQLVDYAMPFRCMQYDSMEYAQQLNELRKKNIDDGVLTTPAEKLCKLRASDRIGPVYTLCLYYGEEPWDGPRSLRDMMDFGEEEGGLSLLFKDYPLFLCCINEETDFGHFHGDVKTLFSILRYRRDKKGMQKLIESTPEYRYMNAETLEVVSIMLNAPSLWENREMYKKENEESGGREEFDMCQALREWIEDERNAGMQEGVKRGMQQGMRQGIEEKTFNVVRNMLLRGMSDEDIVAIAECECEVIDGVRNEMSMME